MKDRLALHTWSLDSTPLAEVLPIAARTGWNAIELRRVDFERAAEAGQTEQQVLDLVRQSGLPVASVGAVFGWMFAGRTEAAELLTEIEAACRRAAALDCQTVMSPVDFGTGDLLQAADRLRQVGDLAARHGVRFALEHQSGAEQLNRLALARELVARANHPSCGLLVDAYHLHRGGESPADLADLRPPELAFVQYSDVPRQGLVPGETRERLPPGQGQVPFAEFFQAIAASGYVGYLSYEGPNPAAWERDPEQVAREAVEATRALLPS